MLDQFTAWIAAVCTSGIIYIAALCYIIPKVRRNQQLRARISRQGSKAMAGWQEVTRMDVKQLKKARIESRVQDLFRNQKSWAKELRFLVYRSGALNSLRRRMLISTIASFAFMICLMVYAAFPPLPALFVGFLASFVGNIMQLQMAAKAWQKKFIRIFPLSLDIIIRGLKSGLTLGRGLAMVSEEIEDPVGTEFHYIVSQLQLGIPAEFAFREASERIDADDFRVFSIALIIQREMGGSLTDILSKLADVVREREKFRAKVWTMSSEARTTAMIVGSLPLLTALGIEFISPGYLKFFVADALGIKMLMTAIALNLTGLIIISRMIRFEA
jgi:tight adherence protein B